MRDIFYHKFALASIVNGSKRKNLVKNAVSLYVVINYHRFIVEMIVSKPVDIIRHRPVGKKQNSSVHNDLGLIGIVGVVRWDIG